MTSGIVSNVMHRITKKKKFFKDKPMGTKLKRREFLKISSSTIIGGAAAYAAFQGAGTKSSAASSNKKVAKGEKVVSTMCEVCFWKCGVNATVKDGKITKLEGNPKHPLSNGMLCPRGTGGIGQVYDPDRLKKPLIRTKVDGKEKWRVASWEEALDTAAKGLLKVREQYGPGKIALYSHGHGGSFFKTLINGMGSGIITAPSYDQCRGPRDTGYDLTYGETPMSPERVDVKNAKCVVFIGSHLGENMHNTPVQEVAHAIDNGATFITVDPRYSIIAGKSKYWLPIKPGTDIALLHAWAHVIIYEELYDKEFVANNVYGFEQYKKYIKDKSPEWAYVHTGIEPEAIKETARIIAKNAPAAIIHPGRHVVWYGDDTQRSRLIGMVNALLGNWGKKGGFVMPGKIPVVKYKTEPLPPLADCDCPTVIKYPLAASVIAQGVCDASVPSPITASNQSFIRAWIVYGCNVPMTLPNPERVKEIMELLDFCVVIDTMPAEVTAYADVVLPECTYLERYDDLHNPGYREPYVAIRQPVIEPMYDSKPGWWMAKELAKRMKIEKYFPWDNAEKYLRHRIEKSGLSWSRLKRDGVIVKKGYYEYNNSKKMKFRTPTGKIEFVSSRLAQNGFDPIPPFVKHEEPPAGYFRLLFGRSPHHTFTRTTNNRELLELTPENEVWINSEMAKLFRLKPGQHITLQNQDGVKSDPVKVRITEGIRHDCVYMVHGFGREDKRLRAGYKKGASDSHLVTRIKRDPIMGGTGMNVNFVTFVKGA